MFSLRIAIVALMPMVAFAADPWVTYRGTGDGIGKGKHIVLVSGDEEYRSEEALPQLGKILAKHHGFTCTVLFAIDPKTGTINPNINNNIPGLEALQKADLMVVSLRFRNLPDEQMKYIAEYVEAGKPVVGLRTSTHAFNISGKKTYSKYHWGNREGDWKEGFGKYVLGETWVAHHGNHGSQATRGIVVKEQEKHPILRGIKPGEIFGPTDVYTVKLPMAPECTPIVLGEVVAGMKFDDKPLEGKKNDPMMPVAWTKTFKTEKAVGRAFTTTMGASQDLLYEGTRRMIVNGCLWAMGMEEKIPEKTTVDLVGSYNPTRFSFVKEWKGTVKPADLAD